MKLRKVLFIVFFTVVFSQICFSQTTVKTKPVAPVNLSAAKSSGAFAEVILRKTELSAELESMLVEYTEDYPKVKELRFEIGLLQKELDGILATGASEAGKLTTALGKLMIRKCELDTEVWILQREFNDAHPEVKRARRKVEIFEAAINEILQAK